LCRLAPQQWTSLIGHDATSEYTCSWGMSSLECILKMWITMCVSPRGPLAPSTRLEFTLWQVPSPTRTPSLLYTVTHLVIHSRCGRPLYYGTPTFIPSKSWNSSSNEKTISIGFSMKLMVPTYHKVDMEDKKH